MSARFGKQVTQAMKKLEEAAEELDGVDGIHDLQEQVRNGEIEDNPQISYHKAKSITDSYSHLDANF